MTELAWIADGKLFLRSDAGKVEPWTSPYGTQVREAARSIQRRHAWKTQGRGAQFAQWGQPMPEDLPSTLPPVVFTGLSRGRRTGEILYVVQTPTVSAILQREPGPTATELRLFHTADFQMAELCAHPNNDKIACSVSQPSGIVNLAMLHKNRCDDITEGDSIDAAPSWSLASHDRLIYQSAGVGRDAGGLFRGRGSFELMALDFESGEVEELVAKDGFDLLVPREAADGTLYYIRRPHDTETKTSAKDIAKDVFLFPVRLGRAVLGWLDFFTVRYSGDPLITAGGPKKQGPDQKWLMHMGNVVDVEKARLESLKAGDETPALVPQDWELVCHPRDGKPSVIAKAVAAYDLCTNGSLVYTNGRAIYHRSGDRTETVATADQVTALLAH